MPVLIPTLEEIEAVVRRVVREELAKAGPPTMSTEEAAVYARKTVRTIRNWIASGELPTQKLGRLHRVRREDLEKFLAGKPVGNDLVTSMLRSLNQPSPRRSPPRPR